MREAEESRWVLGAGCWVLGEAGRELAFVKPIYRRFG